MRAVLTRDQLIDQNIHQRCSLRTIAEPIGVPPHSQGPRRQLRHPAQITTLPACVRLTRSHRVTFALAAQSTSSERQHHPTCIKEPHRWSHISRSRTSGGGEALHCPPYFAPERSDVHRPLSRTAVNQPTTQVALKPYNLVG